MDVKTIAVAILGGAFDSNELGDNDIACVPGALEDLQLQHVTGCDDVQLDLVERSHVDRLTAERDALQQLLNARDEEVDRLKYRTLPDGLVVVPKNMILGKDAIGAINFHCGDSEDDSGMFGEYADGLLWVGSVFDDYGNEVHGLQLSTAEYPEEGSTTLVEFPIHALERKP